MTTVVILNVVLAIFIVAAVLSLLGWGIVTDRAWAATRPFRGRRARARRRILRPRALRVAFVRTQPHRQRR
jgi:hypothetical protein